MSTDKVFHKRAPTQLFTNCIPGEYSKGLVFSSSAYFLLAFCLPRKSPCWLPFMEAYPVLWWLAHWTLYGWERTGQKWPEWTLNSCGTVVLLTELCCCYVQNCWYCYV